MPELPEVETVVRGLRARLLGRKVREARVFSTKIRTPIPKTLAKSLSANVIAGIERRAKYIFIHLQDGQTMVIHLGMTGTIILSERSRKRESVFKAGRHDHLWLRFDDGTELVFSDPRRFGILTLMPSETLIEWAPIASLGPEPLERAFTGKVLSERMAGRKTAIKLALMNQEIVVGVGNIYASEALFHAGISPLKSAGNVKTERMDALVKAVKRILKASIQAGGSSLRDYRQANGEVGFFQNRFSVYDREGQACPGCTCNISSSGGIRRIVQGGRSTFYCPTRQR